jgi:hypothetical protein
VSDEYFQPLHVHLEITMTSFTLTSLQQRGISYALWCIASLATVDAYAQQAVEVVEFYNSNLNHYFVTAGEGEARSIDSGSAGPGWARTGQRFSAFAPPSGVGDAAKAGVPVCRFYALGPNSHFYTANSEECAFLRNLEQTERAKLAAGATYDGWAYEGIAFHADLPNANGECPAGTTAVTRAYNDRYLNNDSNHRFIVGDHVKSVMESQGWTSEGVAFCATTAATMSNPPAIVQPVDCGLPYDATRTARFQYRGFFENQPRFQHQQLQTATERITENGIDVSHAYTVPTIPSQTGKTSYTLSLDRKFVSYRGWDARDRGATYEYSLTPAERVPVALIPGGPGLSHRSLEFYNRVAVPGGGDTSSRFSGKVLLTTYLDSVEPVSTRGGTFPNACVIRSVNINQPPDEFRQETVVWRVPGVGDVKTRITSFEGVGQTWRYEYEFLGYE